MESQKKVIKATGIMGAATLGSRITGLVRDMVVARLFGAGFATDAFFMAFTIPNLLRRFFGEGSLTAAFVPVFSEVLHTEGEKRAREVANACATLLLLVLLAVVAVGILFSPWIVQLIGFGFGEVSGKLELTDQLNRVMFPYIGFVSLLALVTGILNVLGHYFWPSISSAFLNLCMIGSALLLHGVFEVPVFALAMGVLLGGVVQLALQWPVLRRLDFVPRWHFNPADPAVRRMGKLLLPGIAGVAIYQINIVVSRLLASFLEEGSVSWLYYGQRLFEFPQGVFVVSLATALLPALSRHAAEGNLEALKDSLRHALGLVLLVTLPASIGLVLCAKPVFGVFFLGGEFSTQDLEMTTLALMAYAPGLLFVGCSQILVRTFYSLKDTMTPVKISFWTLLVNGVGGYLLMGPFGHLGLALALTLSSIFNMLALGVALKRSFGCFGVRSLLVLLLRLFLPAGGLAVVVWWVLQWGDWAATGQTVMNGGILLLAVAAGVIVFGVGAWAFRVQEWRDLLQLLGKRFQPRQAPPA